MVKACGCGPCLYDCISALISNVSSEKNKEKTYPYCNHNTSSTPTLGT